MTSKTEKIDFASLIVKADLTTQGTPETFLLTNQSSNRFYKFITPNLLYEISADYAVKLLQDFIETSIHDKLYGASK